MTSLDLSTVDHLLTTTRSVRRRLDLGRPVPADTIEQCLRLALQAPTGSNRQGWSWLVVTDAAKRARLAELYRAAFGPYIAATPPGGGEESDAERQARRVRDSAVWLAERLEHVPVHVIPCIRAHTDAANPSLWASIYPAVWSFQLALRSRGLGSVLTTLHLVHEREAAKLLGVPEGVRQAGLLPVAYFTGADFKPARRRGVEEVTYWDAWGEARR